MKRALIDFLACPRCEAKLRLSEPNADGEVQSGELCCEGCETRYEVVNGVPILLDDPSLASSATAALYTDIWKKQARDQEREQPRGYEAPATSHLQLMRLASDRELVRRGIGLDAGCGSGGSCVNVADAHADVQIVGVDLSEGIMLQAEAAAARPNLHFVRGNLLKPPLARESFDFAFSFGVLHHTPAPERAFMKLLERLKPGSPITVFLYKDFSDIPLKRTALRFVTALRTITTRMPPWLLRGLAWLGAPCVWLGLTVPARLLRRLGAERLARHFPYATFPSVRTIASSLEDRFGAAYEHRFSQSELHDWVRRAKLEDAKVVDCLPWGFSGLVVSGIKPRPSSGC
jgi:SAM-dependent methyltransferase